MSFCGAIATAAPVLRDLILTAVAMVGAWAAVEGLRTWREQLRGTADYELARSLLRSLKLWLINSGYQVVAYTAMGAILGVWK